MTEIIKSIVVSMGLMATNTKFLIFLMALLASRIAYVIYCSAFARKRMKRLLKHKKIYLLMITAYVITMYPGFASLCPFTQSIYNFGQMVWGDVFSASVVGSAFGFAFFVILVAFVSPSSIETKVDAETAYRMLSVRRNYLRNSSDRFPDSFVGLDNKWHVTPYWLWSWFWFVDFLFLKIGVSIISIWIGVFVSSVMRFRTDYYYLLLCIIMAFIFQSLPVLVRLFALKELSQIVYTHGVPVREAPRHRYKAFLKFRR